MNGHKLATLLLQYLERLEVVERPEVGEDCGLLGFRVVEAVEALSRACSLNGESWTKNRVQ